jgi:hypothetical protein
MAMKPAPKKTHRARWRRTIEGAPSGMSVLAADDAEVFLSRTVFF